MTPSPIEITATVLFALAILHTFSVKQFQHLAGKYPDGSIGENFFHLIGEVEVVFGLWAGFLVVSMTALVGLDEAVQYIEHLNYTEPLFVFVIMTVAATRPVIHAASLAITFVARLLPVPRSAAFVLSALALGPLLGSFITEPAAMTVTALILRDRLFSQPSVPSRLKYLALGVLFVNVSIGGVLTPYAAPPVLMVANTWGWDFWFMLSHFGWKAATAVIVNVVLVMVVGWSTLRALPEYRQTSSQMPVPWWLVAVHLLFLAGIVLMSHHVSVFLGLFLFFLGVVTVTQEYQEEVKLKESLLVAWFLAGLVTLGSLQSWWLKPLLASLGELPLFLGATGLTAVTDNAALTYLGSQVPGLSEAMQYALVAGAVAGGGLTVIANAPNPAGFSILQRSFGEEGVSPLGLLAGAMVPTLVDMAAFWFLPHLSN